MLLVVSILLLSPFVQTSLLAEEKVIPQASKMCVARLVVARVEEDRKVLEDLPTLVAAAERRKAEDAQELVMAHQVVKSVSNVVRMIIGRVIVQRWIMARRIRRNETLEPTHVVRGPATIQTILVMRSVPQIRFRWIPCVVLRFLLSKTTMSVKLMLHFWWNLKVWVFWTVVQPHRLVALRALKPCSPRVMNMILEFQRLICLAISKGYFLVQAPSPK